MPISFDGFSGPFATGGGYTALMKRDGLDSIVRSIRALLWMSGAVRRSDTAPPTQGRQVWLLANSAANGPMFSCLTGNASTIDRVVSCDATPAANLLVPVGLPALKRAAEIRAGQQKQFKAVVITTPNMWSGKPAYEQIQQKLATTKADIAFLPPDASWTDYWTYPPTRAAIPC
jgi:hypothetical protein